MIFKKTHLFAVGLGVSVSLAFLAFWQEKPRDARGSVAATVSERAGAINIKKQDSIGLESVSKPSPFVAVDEGKGDCFSGASMAGGDSLLLMADCAINLGRTSEVIKYLESALQRNDTRYTTATKISDLLIQNTDDTTRLMWIAQRLSFFEQQEYGVSPEEAASNGNNYVLDELLLEQNVSAALLFAQYVSYVNSGDNRITSSVASIYASTGDFNSAISILESVKNQDDLTQSYLAQYYWAIGDKKKAIDVAKNLRLKESSFAEDLSNIPFDES